MAFQKKGAMVGLALLSVLVAIAVFGRRPALVAWHRWRIEVAFRRVNEVGAYSGDQGDYIESHDYHRRRLVELGYLRHRTFTLRNIRSHTPEYRRLWRLAVDLFPPRGYDGLHSEWPEEAAPMMLEVWDRPANMPRWEAFVRDHDVPDFDERFGVGAEAEPAGR